MPSADLSPLRAISAQRTGKSPKCSPSDNHTDGKREAAREKMRSGGVFQFHGLANHMVMILFYLLAVVIFKLLLEGAWCNGLVLSI